MGELSYFRSTVSKLVSRLEDLYNSGTELILQITMAGKDIFRFPEYTEPEIGFSSGEYLPNSHILDFDLNIFRLHHGLGEGRIAPEESMTVSLMAKRFAREGYFEYEASVDLALEYEDPSIYYDLHFYSVSIFVFLEERQLADMADAIKVEEFVEQCLNLAELFDRHMKVRSSVNVVEHEVAKLFLYRTALGFISNVIDFNKDLPDDTKIKENVFHQMMIDHKLTKIKVLAEEIEEWFLLVVSAEGGNDVEN